MPRSILALFCLVALVAIPGCSLFGSSCDEDTLECYCDEHPENCRDAPQAQAAAQADLAS